MSDEKDRESVDSPANGNAEKENQEDAPELKRAREDTEKSPSPVHKRSRKDKDSNDKVKEDDRKKDHRKEDKPRRDDIDEEKSRKSDRDRDRGRSKRGKSRSRSRTRSRSPRRRKDDKKSDRRKHRNESRERDELEDKHDVHTEDPDVEDGEVREPPREPTARELERLRMIEEIKKEEQEEDVDDPVWSIRKAQAQQTSRTCPYLDTIDRSVLDFDFEKLCSVSMSHLNIYACMVCGKYFQGRGTNTHAYTHALDTDHHVFLNLSTLRFYCLPDNYEICDPSLDDIKYVLKPTYSKQLIDNLDRQAKPHRAFDDSTYHPGVVGLNNIKANDYCNAVLSALSHVTPLRNYFLDETHYSNIKRPPGDILYELPKRFGELMRKLWNPKAFRKHVSPHEMLQATVLCSKKKFQFTEQSDAADFMNFLLNTLHTALNGNQKTSSSIIYKSFRGRMRQYSRKIVPAEASDGHRYQLLQLPEYQESMKEVPFLYLTLDLPPAPLYRDAQLQNIIPQVPLHVLLNKFNGTEEKEYKTYKDNIMKRFELLRLPDYLIITYKRFEKNQWFVEKNPTIVNFPISNVDFYECLSEEVRDQHTFTTYDLVANIVHDGDADKGTYRVQLVHQGSQKWFELEDLHVQEILPQMIVLAECYIQVWKLNKLKTREERATEGEDDGMKMET